ncbi:hypothetical protein CROQUDRAFT_472008 [Cronartium quercuum f. sp. fusiforme G11]|uniref:Uncharacterized protein n=1 Tax=Cronartium quercuum f. sp. fusiforme G11 TaxID=708437 RepID=A0A9P6NPT9_9BASI|nr:hypothetical protein CROQUDRAFT_472008 [Cronartium quercuum f. sp. fusiforme G11]
MSLFFGAFILCCFFSSNTQLFLNTTVPNKLNLKNLETMQQSEEDPKKCKLSIWMVIWSKLTSDLFADFDLIYLELPNFNVDLCKNQAFQDCVSHTQGKVHKNKVKAANQTKIQRNVLVWDL